MENYDSINEEFYTISEGVARDETYYLNGVRHRLDGPAWISYLEGDVVRASSWHVRGLRHRIDGPATITVDMGFSDGYYLGGVYYNKKKEYDQVIREAINLPLVLRLTDPRQWVRELKEEDIAKLR